MDAYRSSGRAAVLDLTISGDVQNPLTMFRLRTNTTEVIVTPDEEHYLIAVQKVSHAADAM